MEPNVTSHAAKAKLHNALSAQRSVHLQSTCGGATGKRKWVFCRSYKVQTEIITVLFGGSVFEFHHTTFLRYQVSEALTETLFCMETVRPLSKLKIYILRSSCQPISLTLIQNLLCQ